MDRAGTHSGVDEAGNVAGVFRACEADYGVALFEERGGGCNCGIDEVFVGVGGEEGRLEFLVYGEDGDRWVVRMCRAE